MNSTDRYQSFVYPLNNYGILYICIMSLVLEILKIPLLCALLDAFRNHEKDVGAE